MKMSKKAESCRTTICLYMALSNYALVIRIYTVTSGCL